DPAHRCLLFVVAELGFASEIHTATDEVPGFDLAFALDRDRPSRLADHLVLDQFLCRTCDLDPPRSSVGLHAARGVHRVPPEVVEEPLPADHTGDDRARGDFDAELHAADDPPTT